MWAVGAAVAQPGMWGKCDPLVCDPAPGARTVLSQRALSSLSAQVDSAELRRGYVFCFLLEVQCVAP